MDQYLLIPFLVGWPDVHQGYKVLTHCHSCLWKIGIPFGFCHLPTVQFMKKWNFHLDFSDDFIAECPAKLCNYRINPFELKITVRNRLQRYQQKRFSTCCSPHEPLEIPQFCDWWLGSGFLSCLFYGWFKQWFVIPLFKTVGCAIPLIHVSACSSHAEHPSHISVGHPASQITTSCP